MVGSSKIPGGSSNPGYVQLTQEEYDRNFGHHFEEEMNDSEEDVELEAEMNELAEEANDENADEKDTEKVVVTTFPVKRGHKGEFIKCESSSSSTTSKQKNSRKKNDDWRVRVPEAGGPVNGDMIPSFGAHIARVLWSNQDARGVLIPRTREAALVQLRHWELPTEAVKIINNSGLSHLVGCMHAHLDMPLLTAFVERWQPDTNTFHMPFGEMTITMHDVEEILKISIDGRGCKISKEEMEETECLVEELFVLSKGELKDPSFTYKNKPIYSGGELLTEGVASKLQEKKDNVVLNAKGWFLVLLGSTLFSDKTSNRVKASMMSLVKDLDRVREYAWGAGTLAFLYRQLGIASRVKCAQICGCLTLLQSWIYEHFRCFRPHVMFNHAVRIGAPRSMLWQTPSTKKDVERLKYIRQKLDEMDPSLVTWLPYCNFPGEVHPNSLYTGFIRFLDVVEPYQPERCLRQFGYTQIIPRPISQPDYHCRPSLAKFYVVKYGDSADDSWLALEDHRIRLHQRSKPANPCYAVANKYIDWYQNRTHPLIIDPSTVRPSSLIKSELLQRTIALLGNVYFASPEERPKQLMNFYNEMLPYCKPYLTRNVSRAGVGPSGRGFIRAPTGCFGPRQSGRGFSRVQDEHEFEAGSSGSSNLGDF